MKIEKKIISREMEQKKKPTTQMITNGIRYSIATNLLVFGKHAPICQNWKFIHDAVCPHASMALANSVPISFVRKRIVSVCLIPYGILEKFSKNLNFVQSTFFFHLLSYFCLFFSRCFQSWIAFQHKNMPPLRPFMWYACV